MRNTAASSIVRTLLISNVVILAFLIPALTGCSESESAPVIPKHYVEL